MTQEERLRVNLNPMQIASLGAFMNVKGRIRDEKKDVYFVRYIGYEHEMEYARKIQEMDHCMNQRQNAGGGAYFRTEKLEARIDPGDVQQYDQAYERHCLKQTAGAQDCYFTDEIGQRTMHTVFLEVLKLYRGSGMGISDSMCHNFGVKLLFWSEQYLPLLFPSSHNAEPFPKFVLSGNLKVQEYLFLYFLACLGCDVLYLNPESDLPLSKELLSLSYGYTEKNRSQIDIPPYLKEVALVADAETCCDKTACSGNIPVSESSRETQLSHGRANDSNDNGNVALDGSRLARPSSQKQQKSAIPNSSVSISIPKHKGSSDTAVPFGKERKELSYEELAQLSASVVMIACHNDKGECFKTGSGVVLSQKGYLLTNFHVACQTAYYSVRFEEEEQVYKTDELVKYNQFYDLAVIKIEKNCSPLPLYQEKKELVRGQKVVAIGSPLGLFNSVSDGIIAGFRVLDDVSMIQFTAPISHGSSGGALLNLYGELIGINTAGFDDGQNINLAVDYKTVLAFARGFL